MAPLPPKRTDQPMRAFVNVGVDYGGPSLVKMGRGRARIKRYICIFLVPVRVLVRVRFTSRYHII